MLVVVLFDPLAADKGVISMSVVYCLAWYVINQSLVINFEQCTLVPLLSSEANAAIASVVCYGL